MRYASSAFDQGPLRCEAIVVRRQTGMCDTRRSDSRALLFCLSYLGESYNRNDRVAFNRR